MDRMELHNSIDEAIEEKEWPVSFDERHYKKIGETYRKHVSVVDTGGDWVEAIERWSTSSTLMFVTAPACLGDDLVVASEDSREELEAKVMLVLERKLAQRYPKERLRKKFTHLQTHVYIMIDDAGKRIAWHGSWLKLSASEYNILSTMMQHPGRVFSRDQLLDKIGEQSLESGDRAIDSHIKNIRRKLANVDPETSCIASVYGAGYRFDGS